MFSLFQVVQRGCDMVVMIMSVIGQIASDVIFGGKTRISADNS